MLANTQNKHAAPGLYVQPDRGLAVAFDNIEAEVAAAASHATTVRVTNPTPAPARVTILVECRADTAKRLPEPCLPGCRVLPLQPGETQTLAFEA